MLSIARLDMGGVYPANCQLLEKSEQGQFKTRRNKIVQLIQRFIIGNNYLLLQPYTENEQANLCQIHLIKGRVFLSIVYFAVIFSTRFR